MRQLLLSITVMFFAQLCYSAKAESDVTRLNNKIDKTRSDLQFQIDKKTKSLQVELNNAQRQLKLLEKRNDSLGAALSKSILENAKTVQENYSETTKQISDVKSNTEISINNLLLKGIVASLLLLLISSIIYIVLHRGINKGTDAIDGIQKVQDKIQKAQEKLQEESANLDTKIIELLNTRFTNEQQKSDASSEKTPDKVDHSLALKVADEITRIEKNLSRMDTSIKGYKPLVRAVERIKDNFKANGYEIVTYIGKTYNEGMRVNPEFVIDEELPLGTRVITSVSKPQVHYKGELIQKATLIVSQNI